MIHFLHVPRATVHLSLALARRALRGCWRHVDAMLAAGVYLVFVGVGLGSAL